MKLWFRLLICLFYYPAIMPAQHDNAFSFAMASCQSSLEGPEAVGLNPAAAVWREHTVTYLNLEHLHKLRELDKKSLHFSHCRNKRAMGFGLDQQGDRRMNLMSFSLWSSLFPANNFSLGLRLRGEFIKLEAPYGQRSRIEADLGFRARLNEKLSLNGLLVNLNRAVLVPELKERSRMSAYTGLSYKASDIVSLCLEVRTDSHLGTGTALGITYNFNDIVQVRCGYESRFHRPSAGLGLTLSSLYCQFAIRYRSDLSYSYSISISKDLIRES